MASKSEVRKREADTWGELPDSKWMLLPVRNVTINSDELNATFAQSQEVRQGGISEHLLWTVTTVISA